MKKLNKTLALILCAVFALTAVACEKDSEKADDIESSAESVESAAEGSVAGLANPMTELESLDALNTAAGVQLCKAPVMGVTDESFCTIAGTPLLAQYKFSVNGVPYCFRAVNGSADDISGIYTGEGTAFENGKNEGMIFASAESTKLARWFVGDVQYVLSADSSAMDDELFAGVASEIAYGTGFVAAADYSALIGSYQDSFSQRASAEVSEAENGVVVKIHWSNSAASYNEWSMTCTLNGNILSYASCDLTVCGEDESIAETTLAAGYFTVEDGKLLWNGSTDENCQSCVFEKIPD